MIARPIGRWRGCRSIAMVWCVFIRRAGFVMVLGGLVLWLPTLGCHLGTAGATAAGLAPLALPLSFQPNHGRYGREVKFLSRQRGLSLLLTSSESILALHPSPAALNAQHRRDARPASMLRMRFIGANASPTIVGLDRLPGKHHDLRGVDPTRWHIDIPMYARVRYDDVYPGVHVVFHGNNGSLEYDLIVEPGIDPHEVRLGFEGIETMAIDTSGNLVLTVAGTRLMFGKPVMFQDTGEHVAGDGGRVSRWPIDGGYRITGRETVGFRVAAYDRAKRLVIDPVLVYSTYLGGDGFDQGSGIGRDAEGNVVVAGTTDGGFPPPGPRQLTGAGAQDVFVAKFAPRGDVLIYSTLLGGGDIDVANDVAVGADGHVYVVGSTFSDDFPVTEGAFQMTHNGSLDAFVLKLNREGNALVYSTLLGKSGSDIGLAVALDSSGKAFVTGRTGSQDFPTTNGALQDRLGGGVDAFVTRLNASGTSLLYSTYLGGSRDDHGAAIMVDSSGHAFVTGLTRSDDFPTTDGVVQPHFGGEQDVFLTRLSPAGATAAYSTYLGGEGDDVGRDIVVDGTGNAYIVGGTHSSDFPTSDAAIQPNFGSLGLGSVHGDAFVSKFSPTGQALVFSTFLGGQRDDVGNGIAVDEAGYSYVAGWTTSDDFPLRNPIQGERNGGIFDGEIFVAKLHPSGTQLSYSTYIGGGNDDTANAIMVDPGGNAYIAGTTTSPDFPTSDAFQGILGRGSDLVMVKISALEQPGLPDLAAEIATIRRKTRESGDQLVVKLHVGNFGAPAPLAPFLVSLFVSDDRFLDAGDRPARQSLRIDQREPGIRKFKVNALEPLVGKFAIIVIDDGDAILEGNENNNVLIRKIEEG